jgi:hypothetical protein
MKKVTISAAVLALALMGCSDAGLDNSVASTNEVKKESAILAKMAQQPLQRGMISYNYYGVSVIVNTYTEGSNGVGEYWLASGPLPNVANVLTVAVAYCDFDQFGEYTCNQHSANFQNGTSDKPNNPLNPFSMANNVKTRTSNMVNIPHDAIGVVSAFGAVWNQGTPKEDVFNAATYAGPLNDYTAYLVYSKYLLQAQDNLLNNRCIDWMPGDDPCHN